MSREDNTASGKDENFEMVPVTNRKLLDNEEQQLEETENLDTNMD